MQIDAEEATTSKSAKGSGKDLKEPLNNKHRWRELHYNLQKAEGKDLKEPLNNKQTNVEEAAGSSAPTRRGSNEAYNTGPRSCY
jgi:hypothetical protein